MAHWLLCQYCMQWSKSSTPFADDLICPLCSNHFNSVKPNIDPDSENKNNSEDGQSLPETLQAPPIQEVSEVPEDSENKNIITENPEEAQPEATATAAVESPDEPEATQADTENADINEVPAEVPAQEIILTQDKPENETSKKKN
ncbi:MAG: hypothetical protein PHF24_07250 [Syntrophomonas sp.]|nr:hypothetical protein [Syntrophomonas sp.]